MLPYYTLLVILIVLLAMRGLRTVTVFEYERGLRYRRGRFTGKLEPGSYRIWPTTTTIMKVDIRPTHIAVPGQEVITADGAGLKITVSAKYHISDPEKAINSVAQYQTALYTQLQLALREIVAGSPIDYVLEKRTEVNKRLHELCAPKVLEFGITLHEADVKDVMFPGELKKVFAQVVKARQEGLAALERARGETAALRNLANAASLLEARPSLMQLRVLQTMGQVSGNTVVLGLGGQPNTIPIRAPIAEGDQAQLPPSGEDEA